MGLWTSYIFGFIVLAAICGTLCSLGAAQRAKRRHWVETRGVIINPKTGSTHGSIPTLRTAMQWHDAHGHTHLKTLRVRRRFAAAPGTAIDVKYDPHSPSEAIKNDAWNNGKIYIVCGIALLIVGLIGLAAFYPAISIMSEMTDISHNR